MNNISAILVLWVGFIHTTLAHPIILVANRTDITPEYIWVSQKGLEDSDFFQPKDFSTLKGDIWLRLEIDNRSLNSSFFLQIRTSRAELFENGKPVAKAGSFVPLYERSNLFNRFALKITIPMRQTKLVYIRLAAEKGFHQNMKLIAESVVLSAQSASKVEMGFLQGVLWVMVLYNMIIFFAIGERSYLYYSLLFGSNAVYFLASDFMLGPLLGIDFALFDSYINNYFSVIYLIFFIFFTINYLQTKKYYPTFHKILIILLVLCGGLMVNFFLKFSFNYNNLDYDAISEAIQFANLCKLPIVLFAIYMTAVLLLDDKKPVRYYAYANIVLFVFGIIYLFNEEYLGVIPANPVTDRAMQAGVIAQALLFSRALAAKIAEVQEQSRLKDIENERIKAQQALEINKLIEQKNQELEQIVAKRTYELTQANALLEENQEELHLTISKLDQTNESLIQSLRELDAKNRIIEQNNRNLMASIAYGSRIQRALLPPLTAFKKHFKDSFIFYLPRDVVSGDLYWLQEREGIIYLAVMDCTGHGVPGAFMSLIGHSIFNQVFFSSKTNDITQMLFALNEGIIQSLQKDTSKNTDGMDISLCAIDKENKTIEFAGAKGIGLIVSDGKPEVIRGDRFSIGDRQQKFSRHVLSYAQYACIYLFTDGYQHQFGGQHNRKFMLKPLLEMLTQNHTLPMYRQMEQLGITLQKWMEQGKEKQLDDILIIGVRV